MRNIAEIIKDDKNGKRLSQTERHIASAYIQGKYDAVMELKIGNNLKNTNEVLDKIRAEIKSLPNANPSYWYSGDMVDRDDVLDIIDKYKAESENKA